LQKESGQETVDQKTTFSTEAVLLGQIVNKEGTVFSVPAETKPAKTTTRVQYEAEKADLEAIRKHLRNSRMAATKIGEHTFKYFLRNEGL